MTIGQMAGNVFADSASTVEVVDVTSKVISEITTEYADSFLIKENRIGKSESNTYSGYTLNQNIKNNRISFTLIAEKGTTLGNLENSQNIYTKKDLGDGRTQYDFYYTLFNFNPQRVININVTPIENIK